MPVARRTTLKMLLSALLLGALTACADGAAGSADGGGTTTGVEWTGEDMSAVVAMAYDLAATRWEAGEQFPRTDEQIDELASAIADRMDDTVRDPMVDGRWSLAVHRGSHEGRDLTSCSDGRLQVRVVISPDGAAIGIAVADATDYGRLVYDHAKVGVDPAFDLEGIASSEGSCTWGTEGSAGVEVSTRDGVLD